MLRLLRLLLAAKRSTTAVIVVIVETVVVTVEVTVVAIVPIEETVEKEANVVEAVVVDADVEEAIAPTDTALPVSSTRRKRSIKDGEVIVETPNSRTRPTAQSTRLLATTGVLAPQTDGMLPPRVLVLTVPLTLGPNRLEEQLQPRVAKPKKTAEKPVQAKTRRADVDVKKKKKTRAR